MLTKPFKPLALAFLVNLIISVEDKIKYKKYKKFGINILTPRDFRGNAALFIAYMYIVVDSAQ